MTMKQLIYTLTLLFCLSTYAQKAERGEKMSLEQRAQLQAKQMQLHLDFSAEKTPLIAEVLEKHNAQLKNLRRDKSAKSSFDNRMALLDLQIALKKEMKKLLSEEEFDAWEKMRKKKRKQIAKGARNSSPKEKHNP